MTIISNFSSDTAHNGITNVAFLNAIFSEDLANGHNVWVTDFPDDPGCKSSRKWQGRVWDGSGLTESANNSYFSIAALKPNSQREVRRTKECFASMRCIILDDLGTKAEASPVEPSWLIETSPGNFQAGFIFDPPISDVKTIQRLCKQLTTKGRLTDAGGFNGVRYARLPVGSNTKASVISANNNQAFQHRLAGWKPDLKYNWQDWSVAMGLGSLSVPANDPEYNVFEDIEEENPVITALKLRGLYKKPLGSGYHDITCPWLDEHTDKIDSGSAYFEPSDDYRRGGFKCHHGHCAQRSISALSNFLDIDHISAQHRPVIRCIGGEIHTIVARAEELLARNMRYFQQGGLICRIVTDIHRSVTSIVALNQESAQIELTRMAAWLKFDRRSDEWVPIDCTPTYSGALLSAQQYPTLANLVALARQPFLRSDGSVCSQPGYDTLTGMFGVFNSKDFPILANPGRADAESALSRLRSLLSEFPFLTPNDEAAALSAMLTAVIRPSLPTAPGFLITAHSSGSGKSYLADMICALADEGAPASATFTGNDEEMRKELIAKLMTGPALIKFDEVMGDLKPIKALLSALSSEHYEGRVLGVSKIVNLSTRVVFLFSGNNVDVLSDMARRVVTITLDPQVEIPAAREFIDDPLSHVKNNRGMYVGDALTIVQAYKNEGYRDEGLKPTNGYDEWSDLCRHSLAWLGLPDPCEAMFEQLKHDPYREQLTQVIDAWYDAFKTEPRMIRDVVKASESNPVLQDALLQISPAKADTIDRRHLGWWVRKNSGKVVNGKRFAKDTTRTRNAELWRLEVLEPKPEMTVCGQPVNQTDSSDSTDSTDSDPDSRLSRESRNDSSRPPEVSSQSPAADIGEVF